MEFVVAGWCARKWLRFYQTVRKKKSYFWWFGKSELKKTSVLYLLDFFEERGRWAGWFSVCGAPLDHWAKGGYVVVLLTCVECGFCPLSWSYYKEWVKFGTLRHVALLQRRQMSVGWHSAYTWYILYYDSRAFRVFVAYCLDCQSPIVEIRVRFPGGHCEAFVKDQWWEK